MEARTGDRPKTEAVVAKPDKPAPRERLLPLSYVEFVRPVPVPGVPLPVRSFERGKDIKGENVACPKMFLDPELNVVVIAGRHFPLALVFYYERAKAA